jgi:hypothetical protein
MMATNDAETIQTNVETTAERDDLLRVPLVDLVAPRALAERYGMSRRTVTRAIERRRLPAVRLDVQWYTTKEHFLRWLRAGEDRSGPVPTIQRPPAPGALEELPEYLQAQAPEAAAAAAAK